MQNHDVDLFGRLNNAQPRGFGIRHLDVTRPESRKKIRQVKMMGFSSALFLLRRVLHEWNKFFGWLNLVNDYCCCCCCAATSCRWRCIIGPRECAS